MKQEDIAAEFGVRSSSTSRKLKRNWTEGRYSPYIADRKACERRKEKGGRRNPEQISGTRHSNDRNGTEYPGGWRIDIRSLEIKLHVEPLINDQELETRGSTMNVNWDGDCKVTGIRVDMPVCGRAYVELLGCDLSHETAGIVDFLFGDTMIQSGELFGHAVSFSHQFRVTSCR
jgi:hypothetical protein